MERDCDGCLNDAISKYDGPILIERLQLITKEGGNTAGKAALLALKHLAKVGHYSPYIDSLVSMLSNLDPEDPNVARFINPQWAISQLQLKQKRLKDLNPDNLYHETDPFKVLELATTHIYAKQYTEAQSVLSSSTLSAQTCQLAECSAQIGLLQSNLSLTLNQEKRIEAFISTSLSNELYLKRLTDFEIKAYWRIKFLVLLAEFLKGNYAQVATSIFELIRSSPIETTSGKEISALDILTESDFGKFIHKDQIVLISVLSILLSYPACELNEVLSETEFISLAGSQLNFFKPFFNAASSAKFRDLFDQLIVLDEFVAFDPLVSRVWDQVKLSFRHMSYKLYLSLVVKVSAGHLSQRLNIPKEELVEQLRDYIVSEKLEFNYNEEQDIFEKVTIDKDMVFVEKLQKLSEDSDSIQTKLRTKLDEMILRLRAEHA